MLTFKVYIRRPLTKPPIWDWSQTVVSRTSADAINSAYQAWVDSKPSIPVPKLSECTSQAIIKSNTFVRANGNILSNADITPAQQSFISCLESKVNKSLGSQLDGNFEMISYPSGFNYGITYGSNAYYNAATLQDIDTLLSISSNGGLELTGGGFSGYYARLLQSVIFVFSQKDQQTMNDQDTKASAQIASIIKEFSNAGGKFSNPLPLGGKLADIFAQLTKTYGSVSNLPDTLNSLRNAIIAYKSMAALSYALHNKYTLAMAYLNAAIANITTPTADNGGMQTGDTSFYVGYTPSKLPTVNQLIGGLRTTGNAVDVDMKLSNFSSDSSQLAVSGQTSFSVPIADVFKMSVNASASYDLSRYTSSSSTVSVNITYPGVTLFAAAPSIVSIDNTQGWYALDILQDVVAKTGKDATGYALQGSEYKIDDVFGPGKIFSRLKTFTISQQPTITMTFTGAESSYIVSDLKVNASVNMSVLGLFSVGSAKMSYNVQSVDDKSVEGSVIVKFGPPEISGTTPLEQQKAFVLGGVASYPPNSI